MLTQSPSAVPPYHVWTWLMAALAALAALLWPRASMMAAPRFCTVGMKDSLIQASSSITLAAGCPLIAAWKAAGYWVALWLPQMVTFLTDVIGTPALLASWVMARLWSRRVMAVKRSAGTSGALRMAINAFVLAGLPTTNTRTSDAALSLIALPCTVKIAPLALSRSLRSMPFVRGRAPTRR